VNVASNPPGPGISTGRAYATDSLRQPQAESVPVGDSAYDTCPAVGSRGKRPGTAGGPSPHAAASGLGGGATVMADACEQPLAEHDVVP
jgi:hypothetical protein